MTLDPASWTYSSGTPVFQETLSYSVTAKNVAKSTDDALTDLNKSIIVEMYDCNEDLPNIDIDAIG